MPQAIMTANATTPAGTMDFKAKQMGKTKTQLNATAGITSTVAIHAILRFLRKSFHAL
jgi:hypothetical protein